MFLFKYFCSLFQCEDIFFSRFIQYFPAHLRGWLGALLWRARRLRITEVRKERSYWIKDLDYGQAFFYLFTTDNTDISWLKSTTVYACKNLPSVKDNFFYNHVLRMLEINIYELSVLGLSYLQIRDSRIITKLKPIFPIVWDSMKSRLSQSIHIFSFLFLKRF